MWVGESWALVVGKWFPLDPLSLELITPLLASWSVGSNLRPGVWRSELL